MRFLLIDRLLALEPGVRASASKTFRGDEDFFADHFPGLPVVPGMLLTESMAQTAGWLLVATLGFERWPLLNMVQSAKFRRFAGPGEELIVEATVDSMKEEDFSMKASVRSGGSRIADAQLFFHAFPLTTGGDREAMARWSRDTFAALGGEALMEGARR